MLSPELNQRAKQLNQSNKPFVVATVVRAQSPTAGKPGDKAIITQEGDIFGWIGGGCAQPAVVKTAREVIRNSQPTLIRVAPGKEIEVDDGIVSFHSSCPSGGTLDIFIEPVYQRPVLWIFGSSPTAIKLAELATVAEFDVYVAAPLGEQAQFPLAVHFQNELTFSQEHLDTECFVVVATQGKRDIASIKAALELQSRFLGFVASAKKAEKYKQDLLEKGKMESDVARIVSPVGLEIGAKSPVDIALSILAQLSQVKNVKDTNVLAKPQVKQKQNTIEQEKETATQEKQGSCCGG